MISPAKFVTNSSRSRKWVAKKLKFDRMDFINTAIADAENLVPNDVDMVTALHACDTATDDAIFFGLKRKVKYFFLLQQPWKQLTILIK